MANLLIRPQWLLSSVVSFPINTDSNFTSNPITRGIFQISIPLTIFLDTLYSENAAIGGRTLLKDQMNLFSLLINYLSSLGFNGKICLLKLICEVQKYRLGQYTILGEMFTLLFTPKKGTQEFHEQYVEAERIGKSKEDLCSQKYQKCPFSLSKLFQSNHRNPITDIMFEKSSFSQMSNKDHPENFHKELNKH